MQRQKRMQSNINDMPIFDGHNDVLLRLPDRGGASAFLAGCEEGHLDLPRAREAGFAGGFFAIFVPSPTVDYSVSPNPDLLIRTRDGYETKLADPIDSDYAYEYASEAITSLFTLRKPLGVQSRLCEASQSWWSAWSSKCWPSSCTSRGPRR